MSEEQEKMTMSQRIDYFYRQSGGPDNPQIKKILDEHLINGKDHGVRGRKEEVKDAFTEVFLNDHSTRPLVLGLLRMRYALKDQWQAYLDAQRPDVKQVVEELKNEELNK